MTVILLSWILPGRQLPPPWWEIDERINWKPTTFYIVVGVLSLILLLLFDEDLRRGLRALRTKI